MVESNNTTNFITDILNDLVISVAENDQDRVEKMFGNDLKKDEEAIEFHELRKEI